MSQETPASAEGSTAQAPDGAGGAGGTELVASQRDRMLEGMALAIAQHGYRGATITEVVRHAKVSKRTFYEEFGDKESCFLELYDRTRQVLEGLIVEASKTQNDWREQIRIGTRAYYTALAAEPRLTHAFFIEIATLSERATKARREAFDHFAALIVEIVEEARVKNVDVPSRSISQEMAVAMIGGMTELLISAIERNELADRIDDFVEVYTDLLASVVTGQFPPGTQVHTP